jgi:hypothetical protein
MKVKRLAALIIFLLIAVSTGILVLVRKESPEEKVLGDRAMTEVQLRTSPNSAFESIAAPNTGSFSSGLCSGDYGFIHKVGVVEFMDTTSPSIGRALFKFCVNTETWQIKFDNDLARTYMTDNSGYISAKSACFGLTDLKNKARMDRLTADYGDTFLRVDPSSENPTSSDFSCTSSFEIKGSVPAVWKLWPNYSKIPALIPDTPFTQPAKEIEKELETRKTNRCETFLKSFSFDRSSQVRISFGGDPELRITSDGYDADDPTLTCDFTYWDEDSSGRMVPVATWSSGTNFSRPEMKAIDDGAQKIDQER